MRLLIFLALALALDSCSTDSSVTAQQSGKLQDTTTVKKWLTKVIVEYVNGDRQKNATDSLRSVMTDDYYRYKSDDITIEYSDMTAEEFNQKWKIRYVTKYVGKGNFFGSTQDSGPIEIPVCTFLRSSGDTAKVFHVETHDLRWNNNNALDITIVAKNNRLYIDDVKEHE
jgi:hypothetical protein